MAREDWPKQVMAACASHFDNDIYNYKIEEDETDTSAWKLWAEFRILGPNVTKLNNIYRLDVIINILLSAVANKTDAYELHKMAGYFQALFTDIEIDILGCLRLMETVDLTYHGAANNDRIFNATLEAPYSMLLKG